MRHFTHFDPARVPSPSYVVDRRALEKNCELLGEIQRRTGCKILLALKGYAAFATFDVIRPHLAGVTASGLHEALLGREFFGEEIHAYSPAFKEDEMRNLVRFAHSLSFNSLAQWRQMRPLVEAAKNPPSCGLRVNPEYAEVEVELYNPCAPGSRLGITAAALEGEDLSGIEGLHFHTMCEQNADVLARTLPHFEEKFGPLIPRMKWVNFGGGHHITRADYDVELLCRLVSDFHDKYGVQVYLEPGEAIAIGTGVLVATVIDIVDNAGPVAILDTSITCHMPDVLEMPYRADILGAGLPGEHAHTYRLGGPSCLAGDVAGEYSFKEPLQPGQRLVFLDMSHYTMVKTTTFNGVPLPAICTWDPAADRIEVVKKFGYSDYRNRLS
jgi:carboxynorspermidine decarboxylase